MKRTEKLLPAQAETFWTTPQAHDAMGGQPERVRRYGRAHRAANLADDVTLWATPTSHPRTHDPRQGDHGEQLANQAALWATPTSRDRRSDSSQKTDAEIYGTKGRPLGRQALRSGIGGPPSLPGGPTSRQPQWPTPRANDAEKRGEIAKDQRNGLPAAVIWQTPHGGRLRGMCLNPRFVSWLMNLPIGWVDFEPLAPNNYERWVMQLSQFRLLWRF